MMIRTYSVVGMTFCEDYPDSVLRLHDFTETEAASGRFVGVKLRRNPENQYDKNAIQVHVRFADDDFVMIGHLPAAVALRLAPIMDGGTFLPAHVSAVRKAEGHRAKPGVTIAIEEED